MVDLIFRKLLYIYCFYEIGQKAPSISPSLPCPQRSLSLNKIMQELLLSSVALAQVPRVGDVVTSITQDHKVTVHLKNTCGILLRKNFVSWVEAVRVLLSDSYNECCSFLLSGSQETQVNLKRSSNNCGLHTCVHIFTGLEFPFLSIFPSLKTLYFWILIPLYDLDGNPLKSFL